MRFRFAVLRRVCAAALLASLVAAAPAPPMAESSPRVERFLGPGVARTLAGATRVEVFRVAPKRAQAGEQAVGGYRVLSVGKEQGEPFARRLAAVLLDEKTYRFDHSKAGGFRPVVGFKLRDGARWVEVLLSFETDELVVFAPGFDGASVRSAQEDFDAARPALLGLVKDVFPDDKEIQPLPQTRAGGGA